ncbi:MAG TPA: DMT family transporter [Clostridia bacterium]|nr:DMT family transporter [Clostridia bacterium]
MTVFFSLLSGALIAAMILVNGELGASLGNYHATVFVHVSGLLAISLVLLFRREGLRGTLHAAPFSSYLGGFIGVLAVVGNNMSFAALGVSATLALGLLGQTAAALFIDSFGWLGARKIPFDRRRLVGAALIAAGAAAMMLF